MNLSLTNDCNRRCAYCFQKSWYLSSDKIEKKELSLDEVEEFLKWIPENMETFSIMGGEPLLYSNINNFFRLVGKYNKRVMVITNASIEPMAFRKILTKNRKYITGLLVNSNYPDSQEKAFKENVKFLLDRNIYFSLSTTLLPDTNEIMKSAKIIGEILDMIDCPECKEKFNVRVSPMAPNHLSNFKFYDYSTDIVNFILNIWNHGLCEFGFDCTVNGCEIHPDIVSKLREYKNLDLDNKIRIGTKPCLEDGAFDYLIDGSIIYCSSCNFLKIENALSEPFNVVQEKMRDVWRNYWKNTGLLCNYKECGKFNPANCLGLCAAKNHLLEGISND